MMRIISHLEWESEEKHKGTMMNIAVSTKSRIRAGRREWTGLAVLVLPALLISMDLSVLYIAVPHLSADLQPSSSQLLWLTDVYGFFLAGFLIIMGTLGDRIGRRRLLTIGAASFGVASAMAAYSSSAELLIVSRALLGIAGATLAPSALALVSTMFQDGKQRAVAIAVWATGLSAGGALGPVVGGAMLEWFWWGSVFLIAVPVMVILVAAAPVVLPGVQDARAGRPDLVSVCLLLVAVLSVIYGLKLAAQAGGVVWASIVSVVVGAAIGLAFIHRQRSLQDPLIDLRLFRHRAFSVSLSVNILGFCVVLGLSFFLVQYLQLVLGLSPFQAGLLTAPMFAGFIGGAMASPLILQRIRPAPMMAAGLAVGALGAGVLTQLGTESRLVTFMAGSLVLAAGLGPVFPLVTNLVLRSAPPARAGMASGMAEASTELGGALGIAVLGIVGSVIYRGDLTGTIPPGTPADVANAAHDTLGGATTATEQLPPDLAAQILEPAREAFASGLDVAAAIGMVALAVAAVVAGILLRHDRGHQAEPTPPRDEATRIHSGST